MDVEILEHFRKKLLERPYRIMDKSGKINEVYYQPERSKREDSTYDKKKDDEMGLYYAQNIRLVEMRCSEHDSNIVRDK
jgi:hypothetical protein